jgi:hypothetical protein
MSLISDAIAPYRLYVEIALVVAIAGGATYAVHHYGNKRAVAQYELDQAAVNKQKAEASAQLAAATAKVRATESALAAFKDKQEITDANNRELTQAQERRLVAIAGPAGRLRDPYAGRGGGSGGAAGQAPASAGGGAADAAESPGLLSKEASRFFLELAAEADEINNAYASCRADALNLRAAVR